jgi:soluble lytic murein transglycosylase-like protein
MDVLNLFAGCGLFVTAHCANPALPAKGTAQWRPAVTEAASMFAMPEAWVSAVMRQESGGQTLLNGRPITSKAGAMGLMQIMPHTYQDLRRQYGLGKDAYNPRDNIVAGTAYLRQMYARYGYPGMFAAYNAGPGRFDAYLAGLKPLPDETLQYLAAIAPGSESAFSGGVSAPQKPQNVRAKDSIFIPQTAPSALFVTLSTGHL